MDDFKKRALFVAAVCAVIASALALMWMTRMILLLFFAGCVGALILSTFTGWFQSWFRLPRMVAFLLVLTAIAAALGLGTWLRGPALVDQLKELQADIPAAANNIFQRLQAQGWGRWLIAYFTESTQVSRGLSYALSEIGGAMVMTASTLVGLFLIAITSIYLAAEPGFYLRGLRRLLPAAARPKMELCLANIAQMLRIWLLAKAISMAIIALFVTVGLMLLGVPLAGTLGVIAGLLTFIPNLGPILSVAPAALLAFAISPLKGLLAILLFIAAHFLEGNVITPLAERKMVTLPPALTLVMQLLFASVAGLLGIAIAAPFTAVLIGCMKALLPAEPPAEPQTLAAPQ